MKSNRNMCDREREREINKENDMRISVTNRHENQFNRDRKMITSFKGGDAHSKVQ